MEFLSEDPGQDKAADTEFFRETFQGQFFGIVGIQIEEQSLLQFQVICVFTHLQRQRWQQVCQQECEIPFRIDLYKKAAKSVGEKSVEMIHVKDILKVTGYIRG